MITRKTTLVLGAGASMPYGYPSGKQLCEKLVYPPTFKPMVDKNWIAEYQVDAFCAAFLRSGMRSIDAFLLRRGKELLHQTSSIE